MLRNSKKRKATDDEDEVDEDEDDVSSKSQTQAANKKPRTIAKKKRSGTKRKSSDRRNRNSQRAANAAFETEEFQEAAAVSDGESALRDAREHEKRVAGRKPGPENRSMVHYDPPVAAMIGNEKRWNFKCRYCNA